MPASQESLVDSKEGRKWILVLQMERGDALKVSRTAILHLKGTMSSEDPLPVVVWLSWTYDTPDSLDGVYRVSDAPYCKFMVLFVLLFHLFAIYRHEFPIMIVLFIKD